MPRYGSSSCLIGSKIYTFGGVKATGEQINSLERIPVQGLSDKSIGWVELSLQDLRVVSPFSHTLTALDDKHLIVFGGVVADGWNTDV